MEKPMTWKEANHAFVEEEEYSAVLKLGDIIAPEYEYDEASGQDILVYPHRAFDAFLGVVQGRASFAFTYDEYMADTEIQDGLKELGIGSRIFWHALLVLHHVSDEKFNHALPLLPSIKDEVSKFIHYLDTDNSSIIAHKQNGRKAEITSRKIIKYIIQCLEAINSELDPTQIIDLKSRVFISDSERISYEAMVLIKLFEVLAKDNVIASGKQYRRPMMLISRILKFTLRPYDEDMAVCADRIKDCMKKYPNPGENAIGIYGI